PPSGVSTRNAWSGPLMASVGTVTVRVVALAADGLTRVTPLPFEVNSTWLSAAFAAKPVPVMIRGLPRTACDGDTEVITGTVKFAFALPANSASTRDRSGNLVLC